MNINKAIKNLIAGRENYRKIPKEEYTQTMDLATEALKRYKVNREVPGFTYWGLLPGETED